MPGLGYPCGQTWSRRPWDYITYLLRSKLVSVRISQMLFSIQRLRHHHNVKKANLNNPRTIVPVCKQCFNENYLLIYLSFIIPTILLSIQISILALDRNLVIYVGVQVYNFASITKHNDNYVGRAYFLASILDALLPP